MGEEEPFRGDEEIEPTRLPLRGPNVMCTLDTPPSPEALRAQEAAVRRHLENRRPEQPDPPGA